MVIDRDGKTIGQDGSSKSITTPNDRSLLLHLRSLSGLIITDAATARAENYRPSKFAPIQIWSKSGDFRCFEQRTAQGGLHELDLVQTPDLISAVSKARQQSHHLLFETGKTLTSALAKLALIDELCLTVVGADFEGRADQLAEQFAAELNLGHLKIALRTQLDGSHFFVMRS